MHIIRKLPVKLSVPQTSKNIIFLSFIFFFYKIGEQEGRTDSSRGGGRGRRKGVGEEYGEKNVYTCM
jgi:hypothetical protein